MNKKSIILYVSLVLNFVFIGFIILNYTPKNTNPLSKKLILARKISPIAGQFQRGYPIDRYYIENFLYENNQYIKGDVLEMEDNIYTYQFGSNVNSASSMDLTKNSATIIHDLQDTKGLPENKFDCFICTQTLPYIYNIHAAFASARKMLKKNGVFLVTAPGISKLSHNPGVFDEYWHFTDKTFYNLAKDAGFRNIKVEMHGNSLAATAFLQGLSVEDIGNAAFLDVKDEFFPVTVTLVAVK